MGQIRIRRLRATAIGTLLALACALAAGSPAEAIVGGGAAPPGRWPRMAGILDTSQSDAGWAQFCGGVVIGARRILTAGHCVIDEATDDVDVLIGRTRLSETQGRRVPVKAISVFPGFVSGDQPGLDAAILTLTSDAGVPPLPLARTGQDAAWAPGTLAWTMGWGALHAHRSPGGSTFYADRLHELQVPVQGDDACENAYGLGWYEFPYLPAWLLCAGTGGAGSGPCYGDSGGPLVVAAPGAWLDVGVVSGGDACAAAGYFTLYARVDRISAFALRAALPVQPDALSLPRVVGPAVVGARVRCMPGRWRGSPARLAIRWTRRDAPGRVLARGPTYRLRRADAHHAVTCSVTATNRGGRRTVAAPPVRPAAG